MHIRNKWDLLYHLVFGTKLKTKLLTDEIISEIHLVFAVKINELGGELLIANGYEDHIHTLVTLPPKISPAVAVKHLKGYSSRILPNLRWQRGYAAFSVDRNSLPRIMNYIKNQKQHHKHGN